MKQPNIHLQIISYIIWTISLLISFSNGNIVEGCIVLIVPLICMRAALKMAADKNLDVDVAFFLGLWLSFLGLIILWMLSRIRDEDKIK